MSGGSPRRGPPPRVGVVGVVDDRVRFREVKLTRLAKAACTREELIARGLLVPAGASRSEKPS